LIRGIPCGICQESGIGSLEKSPFDQYILKVKVTFDTFPATDGLKRIILLKIFLALLIVQSPA